MRMHNQTSTKLLSKGLWVPISIIFVGCLFSTVFAVRTLKSYRQAKPLLIKPSSVETPREITVAVFKALYPLKMKGYSAKVNLQSDDLIAKSFSQSLIKTFPVKSGDLKFIFNTYSVSLSDPHDPNKTDCLNTALFNLKRKPKRKWKKRIYFTVCTEEKNKFSLFYTTKKIP